LLAESKHREWNDIVGVLRLLDALDYLVVLEC
jgi:hypothetical protein